MNNFKLPKQWLREGKKIRLPHWQEDSYWELSKDGYDRIIYSDKSPAKIHLNQLEDSNWEIVKSKDDIQELQKFIKTARKLIKKLKNE